MIETLISSKTRIKLLMKFFINSHATAYLRSLESEFGESSNAIRVELNRLERAGMLVSQVNGNKKIFRANTEHPLFGEIHNILLKQIGLDRVIEDVVERLGEVERVFLIGEFSRGIDSQIIDLVLIGLTLGVFTMLQVMIHRTKLGKAMRACSQDKTTARLVGVNVDLVVGMTFFIGSMLAAAVAPLYVVKYALVRPDMGLIVGILAFASAVLGGRVPWYPEREDVASDARRWAS